MALPWAVAIARDLLFPPLCAACGAEIAPGAGMCGACFAAFAFITGPVCPRCGAPGAGVTCEGCAAHPPGWARGRAVALYEGPARKAVLALKHGDRLDIARAAAGWMAQAGADLIDSAEYFVPVPLHWTRLARRRANQSAELARALAAHLGRGDAYLPDALRRTRRTASQEGKNRAARRDNVHAAFCVPSRRRARLRGARILLIDDVMTTGATLTACAEALRAAGAAEIDALVLTRVDKGLWSEP